MTAKARLLSRNVCALNTQPHIGSRHYYSKTASNGSGGIDEKKYFDDLSRLADTLSQGVLEKDGTVGDVKRKAKRPPQSNVLPEFESRAFRIKPEEYKELKDGPNTVRKATAPNNAKTGKIWTEQECGLLLEAVKKSRLSNTAAVDWNKVAAYMDGRTLKAIKHRHWVLAQMKKKNELDGAADRNKRSRRKSVSILPEEKKAIKEAVRIYGEKSWERVAEHVAKAVGITRAAPLVSQIWFYGLCPKTQSAPRWNEERNSRLKALVKEHGRDSVFLSYKFFPEYPPPFLSRLMARLGSKHENSDPRLFRSRSPDALIEKDKKPQGK